MWFQICWKKFKCQTKFIDFILFTQFDLPSSFIESHFFARSKKTHGFKCQALEWENVFFATQKLLGIFLHFITSQMRVFLWKRSDANDTICVRIKTNGMVLTLQPNTSYIKEAVGNEKAYFVMKLQETFKLETC